MIFKLASVAARDVQIQTEHGLITLVMRPPTWEEKLMDHGHLLATFKGPSAAASAWAKQAAGRIAACVVGWKDVWEETVDEKQGGIMVLVERKFTTDDLAAMLSQMPLFFQKLQDKCSEFFDEASLTPAETKNS